MKVVINRCWGEFSISRQAAEVMASRGNERAAKELDENPKRWFGYGYVDGMDGGYERTDPDLIYVVEELKEEANGEHAKLKIVEIPDGIQWEIDEYDGMESIEEVHRSWR